MERISRRSFIEGAALAGATTAALTAAPAASLADEATAAGQADVDVVPIPANGWAADYAPAVKWSWQTKPAPIDESLIVDTTEADVLVIGAGIGGLAAACHSAELGDKVVVIEKNDMVSSRGGHFAAADSKALRAAGISMDKEEIAREWIKRCSDRCREEIVWLWLNRSGEAMDWLIDKAEAKGFTPVIYDGNAKGERNYEYPGTHMFGGSAEDQDGLTAPVYLFWKGALEAGAEIVYNMPAQQLLTDEEGAVIGAVALDAEGAYHKYLAAKGVVLATGDFGGDPEMLECYAPIGLRANANYYTPFGCNTGDGHKMGMWVGAQMEMASIPTSLHLVAYTWQGYGFLHVNTQGKRFMNENNWVQAKSIKILQQPGEDGYVWSVFDSNWPTQLAMGLPYGGGQFWDGMGRCYGQEWMPESDASMLESNIEGGTAVTADTLEGLADAMGVDRDTFLATVERYNELAAGGKDLDYGKEWQLMNTIAEPPFYATKIGPALMGTNGGLVVDEKLRVLDRAQEPIRGLYAIGNCMGGRYGNDYPIIMNGTTHGTALAFGYLVGEFIDADNA